MATKVERKIIKQNHQHHTNRTRLYVAASEGNLNLVQNLVLSGAIVNDHSRHYNKETPIFGASGSRVVEVINYLLRCGADPTLSSSSGHTCIHEACKSGYLNSCKALVEFQHDVLCPNGIDLWVRNNAGWNAFHWAVYSGSKKVVKWLLESEQRKNVQFDTVEDEDQAIEQKKNNTTVSSAQWKADQEYEDIADLKYEQFMYTVVDMVRDNATNNGFTPLHIAAQQNDPTMLLLLLEYGAGGGKQATHIDVRNNAGDTPLHVACIHNSVLAATCLINSGSVLFATNRFGQTAFHRCVMVNNIHIVELLLSYCSTHYTSNKDSPVQLVHLTTNMNWTNISLAVRAATSSAAGAGGTGGTGGTGGAGGAGGAKDNDTAGGGRDSIAVLQLLAKWCGSGGVDSENDDDDGHEPLVETMTKSGLSPLMLACGEGLINVAYYLLTSMHAEPNSQNTTGYAPLHAAARGGHDAVVSLMLEQGADLSIEDENGWTSLHFAAKEGHVSTCSMLCQHLYPSGGTLCSDFMSIKNVRGESAARIAFKWGKQEVLDALSYYE